MARSKLATMGPRERQYHHVLEALINSGKPFLVAERIAAAVVNKQRAKDAATGKGPQLITKGGSRRQFYPGKRRGARPVCLQHQRVFTNKAGWLSHLRSKLHARGYKRTNKKSRAD